MHVHMSPAVQPQGPAVSTPKPARPASPSADLHALAALGKDRDGSGSQPRQRRDARQPRTEPQASVATGPAATLAALLVALDLDARSDEPGPPTTTPVEADPAPESPLERFLRDAG